VQLELELRTLVNSGATPSTPSQTSRSLIITHNLRYSILTPTSSHLTTRGDTLHSTLFPFLVFADLDSLQARAPPQPILIPNESSHTQKCPLDSVCAQRNKHHDNRPPALASLSDRAIPSSEDTRALRPIPPPRPWFLPNKAFSKDYGPVRWALRRCISGKRLF
jgi:hypothetical protein